MVTALRADRLSGATRLRSETSRAEKARRALRLALEEDRLRPGSFATSAVGVILEAFLGTSDPNWGYALVAHFYGVPRPDGTPALSEYADRAGFTVGELVAIHEAFEGLVITPGAYRLPTNREPLSERVERVSYLLGQLDRVAERAIV